MLELIYYVIRKNKVSREEKTDFAAKFEVLRFKSFKYV